MMVFGILMKARTQRNADHSIDVRETEYQLIFRYDIEHFRRGVSWPH
jgi:hypothetical protein